MSGIRIDLSGQVFGRLTVISLSHRDRHGYKHWFVRCICGVEKSVSGSSLTSGKTQSCGCLMKERTSAANKKHGATINMTPEYISWNLMRDRCNNPNNKKYNHYGGRGISVCERWNDFNLFLQDMGKRPTLRHSLDRYPNPNGNYEPNNCRWATQREQMNNMSRNVFITYNGESFSKSEWSRRLNISPQRLNGMLNAGNSFDEIYIKLKET